MRTIKLLFFLNVVLYVSVFAQKELTTVRTKFDYENQDKEYEWYIKRKITANLIDKIDVISNDSISFIEFQFTDEIKNSNNGYIYLSTQKEVDSFINDLTSALQNLSQKINFESTIGKYKIEVADKKVKKNTFKTIKLYETIGGDALICLNADGALKLLNWIKDIKL